jgi:hypothetical protein
MAASMLFQATATGISFASRYASRTFACGVSVHWDMGISARWH